MFRTPTLRSLQKDAIVRMLNLNKKPASGSAGKASEAEAAANEPIWKILVFDKIGQKIVSSLLKVNDLRENGITIHMGLHSDRPALSDVPAIYFVDANESSVKRIVQDIQRDLYELYYLNFVSSLPRPLLEDLAQNSLESNASHQIAQIYDQYCHFISTNDNMFTLDLPHSFSTLNRPTAAETEVESLTDSIAQSLFSVCVTLGNVPVIRCPRNGAAEMIARKLEARLREHVASSKRNLFTDHEARPGSQKTVLIILDRTFDLSSMLLHTWSYQTLIQDLFGLNLNRVRIEAVENEKRAIKDYDLTPDDFFWSKNAPRPFPEVAEQIDAELTSYRAEADRLTVLGGVDSLEAAESIDMTHATKQLKTALSALPQLTARKAVIDMHMNIATALLESIKERQLDVFFECEEAITKQTREAILGHIRDPEKKSAQDKLRLFILYILATDRVSASNMGEFEEALLNAGCDLAALDYIKDIRAFAKIANAPTSSAKGEYGQTSGDLLGRFTSIGSRLTGQLTEGSYANLMAGLRNLLPSTRDLPITRIVESITDMVPLSAGPRGNPAMSADDYLSLDPTTASHSTHSLAAPLRFPTHAAGTASSAFQDAIVFVAGGGNYLEYQNLQEFAGRSGSVGQKRIVYGATDLLNAEKFLAEMAACAQK